MDGLMHAHQSISHVFIILLITYLYLSVNAIVSFHPHNITAQNKVIFYAIAEAIGSQKLMINDAGGSISIHTFGAFFGLAVSYMTTPKWMTRLGWDTDNRAGYHSDFFSMLGTIFLFLYWPSFK